MRKRKREREKERERERERTNEKKKDLINMDVVVKIELPFWSMRENLRFRKLDEKKKINKRKMG